MKYVKSKTLQHLDIRIEKNFFRPEIQKGSQTGKFQYMCKLHFKILYTLKDYIRIKRSHSLGEANYNTYKPQSISKQYKENSFESMWKRQTTDWKNRQRKNEQETVGILLKKKIKSPINTWTILIFTRIQGEEMQAKPIVRYYFTPLRLQTDKNSCLKTLSTDIKQDKNSHRLRLGM